jgi:hypothetical protein
MTMRSVGRLVPVLKMQDHDSCTRIACALHVNLLYRGCLLVVLVARRRVLDVGAGIEDQSMQ